MRGFRPGELHITGVDRNWQPRYVGDDFFQADAMEVLLDEPFIRSFHFLHLSPPCQKFSPTRTLNPNAEHRRIDLLTPSLKLIKQLYPDKLVVIENVPQAPMYSRKDQILRLCASSFPGHTGFDARRLLHRHRIFRLRNLSVPQVRCNHNGFKPLGVYGALNSEAPGGGEMAANMGEAQKLMQIEWMKWLELKEAIPPAYTEYISAAPGGLREVLL